MRLVAFPDQQGHYQLEDGYEQTAFAEGIEELIGVLVGYLAGPLSPETSEEEQERGIMYVAVPEAITRD